MLNSHMDRPLLPARLKPRAILFQGSLPSQGDGRLWNSDDHPKDKFEGIVVLVLSLFYLFFN